MVYIVQEWLSHTDLYEQYDDVKGKILGVYASSEAAALSAARTVADLVDEWKDDALMEARVEYGDADGNMGDRSVRVGIYYKDGDELDKEYEYKVVPQEVRGSAAGHGSPVVVMVDDGGYAIAENGGAK